MRAAREQAQDARSIGRILGLAQDDVVEGDGGVGTQHSQGGLAVFFWFWMGSGELAKDGLGFFTRQPRDIDDRILAGQRIFRNMRRTQFKPVADLGEQFTAARRGGGENQHDGIMAGPAEAGACYSLWRVQHLRVRK